ncbi:MAG: YchF/TatD family DNA exonuclease [Proteobacteria bacterium]|nr:YchF/TatD family DNA exonuclease [Pseudomonadota bacterium]
MNEYVDVHTHLEMPEFDTDREDVIKRASSENFTFICTVGTEPKYWGKAQNIANTHNNIYFSVGLHPHEADIYSDELEKELLKYLSDDKCLIFGEIGLDFFKNYSPREKQIEVFNKQLDLAEKLNMPVMIHIRDAHSEAKEILKKRALKGIIHCFSGDVEDAKFYINLGYFISIPGTVTFKKATNVHQVVKEIPLDYLLTETDAPFLAPEPFRGKRNEPLFVKEIVKKIAEIKGISTEDVCRTVKLNTLKAFRLDVEKNTQIVYKIRNSLYINLTNRCTNKCVFCGKNKDFFVKGHFLKLNREPALEEIISSLPENLKDYDEVVYCGYGEPTLRFDIIKQLSPILRERGAKKIRLNTDGLINLREKRDTASELSELIDAISISLNASDEETYNKICRPQINGAFKALVDFISSAKSCIKEVTVTAVALPDLDMEKIRNFAEETLKVKFRKRPFDDLG